MAPTARARFAKPVAARSCRTASRQRSSACRRQRCSKPAPIAWRRCPRSVAQSLRWRRPRAVFRDGPERLLVFGVGAERFGIALATVDEVVDAPQTRELPDSPPSVLGITTVRGVLVTIYDPRPLLNVDGAVNDAALLF